MYICKMFLKTFAKYMIKKSITSEYRHKMLSVADKYLCKSHDYNYFKFFSSSQKFQNKHLIVTFHPYKASNTSSKLLETTHPNQIL